jgi:hypothetical protein
VFLPEGLTLEEAVRINMAAQAFDGVASIEEDGTVVLTEQSASIFKKLLDYDCRSYAVADCEAKVSELNEKFKRWASQFRS